MTEDGKTALWALVAALATVAAVLAARKIYSLMSKKELENMASEGGTVQPVVGRVSSPYGQRTHPVTGQKSSFHGGTDIAVPVRTPVRAPWDGVVKSYYLDQTYGGGQTMIVKHDNGYQTGYCHLSGKPDGIEVGSQVQAGDIICYSGGDPANQPMSGSSTGPHLHISLRNRLGQRIDPQTAFNFQS